MELFVKIVNGFQPLNIFVKSFLDVRLGSEYASHFNKSFVLPYFNYIYIVLSKTVIIRNFAEAIFAINTYI